MISITQVFLVLPFMLSVHSKSKTDYHNLDEAQKLFNKFIKDFGRMYIDQEDKRIHFKQFKANLQKINDSDGTSVRSINSTQVIDGISEFADLDEQEVRERNGFVPRVLRNG